MSCAEFGSCGVQMNEPALLNTCHSVQVSRILKWRVARTYQADMLLKVRPVPCTLVSCIGGWKPSGIRLPFGWQCKVNGTAVCCPLLHEIDSWTCPHCSWCSVTIPLIAVGSPPIGLHCMFAAR